MSSTCTRGGVIGTSTSAGMPQQLQARTVQLRDRVDQSKKPPILKAGLALYPMPACLA
ncbi:MAG: hypothetical protein R3C56_15825 [Pirellulaceae bacterium]